ncbi:MAG: hypothetical protein M3N59_01445 [bacterium]|nr:hypothetical protein [bacterium]
MALAEASPDYSQEEVFLPARAAVLHLVRNGYYDLERSPAAIAEELEVGIDNVREIFSGCFVRGEIDRIPTEDGSSLVITADGERKLVEIRERLAA